MSNATSARQNLYLEDLSVGQRFSTGSYEMDEARMKAFAAEFDPQPFHIDNEAAEASLFKGLAGSGWYSTAVAMKLLTSGGIPLAEGIIGLGCDVQWPRATRPGDVVTLESEITEIAPSRSKPNQAVVTVRCTMLNQKREAVMYMTPKMVVFRRPE